MCTTSASGVWVRVCSRTFGSGVSADGMSLSAHTRLDISHDLLRFVGTAMRHQPPRAFRQPQPHEENDQRQQPADQEGGAPADARD